MNDFARFSLPMDADPSSDQRLQDDAGRTVYVTRSGQVYALAPRRPSAAAVLDEFGLALDFGADLSPGMGANALAFGMEPVGRFEEPSALARTAQQGGAIVNALAQGVAQGVTAPRRAAQGEDVTLGDVWSTALDWGALGLPVGAALAPEGAVAAGGGKPIRAYHGSPHDFDRFDMSRIGTGTGERAYGHGLYFSDSEAAARSYRDGLTQGLIGIDGRLYLAGQDAENAANKARFLSDGAREQLARTLRMGFGPEQSPPKRGRSDISDAIADELEGAIAEGLIGTKNIDGRMYEVDINAGADDFLDWGRPFSEQPKISDKLRADPDIGFLVDRYIDHNEPMMAIEYNIGKRDDLFEDISDYRKNAAGRLNELGVAGVKIRYPAENISNFVVFDDRLIEIVRKYGIAGAAAMLGMSEADVIEAMGES